MVKIAVIDSGIDSKYLAGCNQICGGIGYEILDGEIVECDYKTDYLGHGTSCVDTILNEVPFVKIFVVKILNELGKTSIDVLIKSLEALYHLDINIINLSISLTNTNQSSLKKVCRERSC